jgi:hypothetical protein
MIDNQELTSKELLEELRTLYKRTQYSNDDSRVAWSEFPKMVYIIWGMLEDNIKQLTTTQQKLDSAVEALKFYADEENYQSATCHDFNAIDNDFGEIAKAALASISGKEE